MVAFMTDRKVFLGVSGIVSCLLLGVVISYNSTAPDILVASPVALHAVQLKPTSASMPLVYEMQPVQPSPIAMPSSATSLSQVSRPQSLPVAMAFPLHLPKASRRIAPKAPAPARSQV